MTNPSVPPADSSKAGSPPESESASQAETDTGVPEAATRRFGELPDDQQAAGGTSAEPAPFDATREMPPAHESESTAWEGPAQSPSDPNAEWGTYPPEPPVAAPPVAGSGHHHYPRHETVRDRVWPHLVWELLLAAGVAALFLVFREQGSPGFEPDDYKPVWWWASMLGLLTMGFSLSLRVGVPNLAVGPIFFGGAVLASMIYREQDWSVWSSVAVAVTVAAVAGLLLGTIVVVLHVPAWVASLGAGLAVLAWTLSATSTKSRLASVPNDGPNLFPYWEWIFLGIAAVSVLGGTIGSIWAVRSSWAVRTKTNPATRPGTVGVLASLVGMALSSAMAAGAGSLLWIGFKARDEASSTVPEFAASDSLAAGGLIVLVLATVLLGGVSAFGRRGGFFGTMLATLAMVLLVVESVFDFGSPYSYLYLIAGVLLLGLVVNRILEAACVRPQPAPRPQPQTPYPGWSEQADYAELER